MSRRIGNLEEAAALVWFRDDLRLADNPALHAAAATDRPLFCFYVVEESSLGVRPLGGASKWWLHHSLASLAGDLERAGGRLHLFRGATRSIVAELTAKLAPAAAFWNRRYGGTEMALDQTIADDIARAGVRLETFNGTLLYEPREVVPKSGGFYHVYGPWWRAAQARPAPPAPLPAPPRLRFAPVSRDALPEVTLDDLALVPTHPDWAGGLRAAWNPGEPAANQAIAAFVAGKLWRYAVARDNPALAGSSRLSPHLRFGEISPNQIVAAVHAAGATREHAQKFLQEVAWRDFCASLLFNIPDLPVRPFSPRFAAFPFRNPPPEEVAAWRRGSTGYPIVDAGMRQLWQTGTMHNRVRMIAASFLVKHLLADWRVGEAWFWDTLCDADAANNAVNWQWVAGSGPDAAPFFRIFNPVLQGEKFDADGAYVRQFVPELKALAPPWVHKPWAAPPAVLAAAGVELGTDYPHPIVDHAAARTRALATFQASGQSQAVVARA